MKKPTVQRLLKVPCDNSMSNRLGESLCAGMKALHSGLFVRIALPVLVSLLVITGTGLKPADNPDEEYFSISKSIELLGDVYTNVSGNYVDSLDVAEFMYAGIDGMLDTLDPYTVFLDEDESLELGELTSGQYAGIGVRIADIAGDVFVVSVFGGTPASAAGLQVGDRIVKVDGKTVEGYDLDEVRNLIKGPSGTGVRLAVERYGKRRWKRVRMVRQEVRVNSIRFAGLYGSTGYLEMHSFGNRSADELGKAIRELRTTASIRNTPMKAVILDLRNNPGGLLDVAVDVTGLFVPKGSMVVSTRGRDPESSNVYRTTREPLLDTMPLAVLINRNSASASEIVAGAIQELDRGVVVGDRSFGKGLVQSVISLPYDCTLKMTTAKYYTPSGRLIQKPHDWRQETRDILAGTKAEKGEPVYYTKHRRKVYGGGGILPDIRIEAPEIGDYESALRRKGMLFRYANHYKASHERLPAAGIDRNVMMQDFSRFLNGEGFAFRTESELLLEDMKKMLGEKADTVSADVDTLIVSLQNELKQFADKKKSSESETIAIALEEEVLRHYDEDAARRSRIERDPVVKKARSILEDSGAYKRILHP